MRSIPAIIPFLLMCTFLSLTCRADVPDSLQLLDSTYPFEKRVYRIVEAVNHFHATEDFYTMAEIMQNALRTGRKEKNATIQVYSLVGLAHAHQEISGDSVSMQYTRRAHELVTHIPDKWQPHILTNLSWAYLYQQHDPDSALLIANQLLKVAQKLKEPANLAMAYSNLLDVYIFKGNTRKAMEALYLEREQFKKLPDNYATKANYATNLWFEGKLNLDLKNYEKARRSFYDQIAYCKEFNLYTNMVDGYLGLLSPDVLTDSAELSLLFRQISNTNEPLITNNCQLQNLLNRRMGEMLDQQGLHAAALPYLKAALHFLDCMSEHHRKTNEPATKALFLKVKAELNPLEPEEFSPLIEKEVYDEVRVSLLKMFSRVHELRGYYDSALIYERKARDLYEKVLEQKQIEQTRRFDALYQSEQKEARIARLEGEQKVAAAQAEKAELQKRLLIYILLATAVVLAVIAWFLYRLRNRNRLIELQKSTLEEKTQALSVANRTKERFFAIVSHDLRSPLGRLRQLFHLHRHHLEAAGNTPHEALDELEENLMGVSHLLQTLLQWSMEQQVGIVPRLRTVSLQEIMEEAHALARPLALYKSVYLTLHPLHEAMVNTDPDMVAFIVRNLVFNAIKHSLPEGNVVLRLSKTEDNALVLEVRDDGIGMPEELMTALQNGDNTESTEGTFGERGTGLGLQLSRQFASRINATLHFESRVGQGTTVSLVFDPVLTVFNNSLVEDNIPHT